MATASARVFLIRHGDTDWITGGKHASRTEVPLSKQGERETELIRERIIGENRLIDPLNVARIYCSPREVAIRTVQILKLNIQNHQHFYNRESGQKWSTPPQIKGESADPYVQITKALQEWDYGDYEGLTALDIHELRKKEGLDKKDLTWNIWSDGCPNGETPQQVSDRLDDLITEMKSVIEANSSSWPSGQIVAQRAQQAQDIVCIAHGHILAALARRWVGLPLHSTAARMVFEPAGVAVLGFEHDNINQPAIMLGRMPRREDWTI